MSIDPKYLDLFIKATEKAAIGASKFIGKKDKIAADKGAVDPMRSELNKINMEGTCLLYTSPSPRDAHESRMPSAARKNTQISQCSL